jgi:predicted metal-dependent RNase
MSYPTKAICPILLEDYRKITAEMKRESNFFTSEHIKACMRKGISIIYFKIEKFIFAFSSHDQSWGIHILGRGF